MTQVQEKALFIEKYIKGKMIQVLRHIPITKQYAKQIPYGDKKILTVDEGRQYLCELISSRAPFMAARFGTSEGAVLFNYYKKKIIGGGYSEQSITNICTNAGFFPKDVNALDRFSEAETDACKDLDLLGVMNFVGEEWIV